MTIEGERVSQQASPRGTFLKIADAVKARVDADADMTELPSAAELMSEYKISRGSLSVRSRLSIKTVSRNRCRVAVGVWYGQASGQTAAHWKNASWVSSRMSTWKSVQHS